MVNVFKKPLFRWYLGIQCFFLLMAAAVVMCGIYVFRRDYFSDFKHVDCTSKIKSINNSKNKYNDEFPCSNNIPIEAGSCSTITNKCLPSFSIIGSMKSGTGVLMKLLNQHPNAQSGKDIHTGKSEVSFFGDNLKSSCILKDYSQHFPLNTTIYKYTVQGNMKKPSKLKSTKTNFLWFDKTPYYIRESSALEQLTSNIKNIKLIVLFRKPSTRAYSGFQHNCRHRRYALFNHRNNHGSVILKTSKIAYQEGWVDSNGQWTEKAEINTTVLSYPCTSHDFELYIGNGVNKYNEEELSIGDYGDQMKSLLSYTSQSNIHVVVQEEMHANTMQTMRDVESFLGLPCFNDYVEPDKHIIRRKTILRLILPKAASNSKYPSPPPHIMELLDKHYAEQVNSLETILKRSFNIDLSSVWMKTQSMRGLNGRTQ